MKHMKNHYLPWIPGNPDLWKPKHIDAISGCFLDQRNRLVDTTIQIQPHRLGLNRTNPDNFRHDFASGISRHWLRYGCMMRLSKSTFTRTGWVCSRSIYLYLKVLRTVQVTYNTPLEPSIFAQVLHTYATGESVKFNKWPFSASCIPSSYPDVIGRGCPTEDRKLLPCPGRVPDANFTYG